MSQIFKPNITCEQRFNAYADLIRIRKPIGIYLVLWPVLWSLWLASEGLPNWHLLLVFVLGTLLMRSAGCAINDYADRNIDGHVSRTKQRPLATGKIYASEALFVFASLSLIAFMLVLTLDGKTIVMSFVAVFLAVLYPFMKRYTHLPQLVLGMAFGWAVPMSYVAVSGEVSTVGWLVYAATVIWALIYDTQYAMVDREDDLKIGVKSTAILFADKDRLIIWILQIVMLALLMVAAILQDLGVFFWIAYIYAVAMAVYQQMMIRNQEPKYCFQAFLNNHYLGMTLFAGIFLDYLFN